MLRIPFLLSAALLLAVPAAAEEAKGLPVGACINMGNSLETMVESQDGKRIDAADFARIRAAGFTTARIRSEEHTSELQSLMRISYAVFCLKKNTAINPQTNTITHHN